MFLCVAATIGVGVLMQTWALGHMGVITGSSILVVSGLASMVAMYLYYDALCMLRDLGLRRDTAEMCDCAEFVTGSKVAYNFAFFLWNFNLFFTTCMLYILFGEQMDLLAPLASDEYSGKARWRAIVFPFVWAVVNYFPDMKSLKAAGPLGIHF